MYEFPLPNTSMPKNNQFTRRAAKGVNTMLKRLRSSFLRSSAVRHTRVDEALTGRDGHLLFHYFNSIR